MYQTNLFRSAEMSFRGEKNGISTMPSKEGDEGHNSFSLSVLESKRSEEDEEGEKLVEDGWSWKRVEKLPGLGVGFIFLTVILFQVINHCIAVDIWKCT